MKSKNILKSLVFCVAVFTVSFCTWHSVYADAVRSGFFKKNALVTDYFQIEYSNLLAEQTDSDSDDIPDIVEVVSEAATHARDVIVEDLNYDDPMEGYDRELIIILDDNYEYLSEGAMGVTSLLSNGDPYIAIDPWMADQYLEVTVGHEFFHAVQFAYDASFAYTYQGINWAEATATWMEDNVYDDINDYVNYLTDYFTYPDYSVFASISPTNTLFEYGLAVWPTFLSEYYGNNVIKDIWMSYFDSSIDYDNDLRLYDSVDDVISESGDDLDVLFSEFALWNLDTSYYEEGDLYPSVFVIDAEETGSEYDLIDETYAPALFGTNYLYFENSGDGDDFYFHVVKPEGISFAVSLVPDDGSLEIKGASSTIIGEDEEMTDPIVLSDVENLDGVYAVVSPLGKDFDSASSYGVFDEGYLYYYLADYSDSSSQVDSSLDESVLDEEDTANDKEGEEIGSDDVRETNTLTLSVVTYNEDSVSFKWNRLNDSDIAGYELRYGTESDEYTKEKTITASYTTSTTVSDLKKDQTYYFELVALDSDGKAVLSPSQEISVTTSQWLFTDVSYMDENYDAIAGLSEVGILDGYSNGSFKPEQEINRAEFLKVLIEARNITPDGSKYNNCFKDVGDDWYAKYVCYAKDMGWVNGYSDGSFKPSQSVNKVEALKILFQVYEEGLKEGQTVASLSYPDLDPKAWYAIYVWRASKLGILQETLGYNFYPDYYRNRGDIAEEVYRYLVTLGEI